MIRITNLTKKYGDFSLQVDLEIPDGRITGLIGKNGAGKSTVIKSILGLIHPDSGEILIQGKETEKMTAQDKENLGVALSDSGFSNYLTISDIVKIMDKLYSDFEKEKFLILCRNYQLPEKKLLQKFSSGMKAKLRVLIALSHKAKVLILDEPTAGMDVEARNEILDMLRDYLTEHEDCSVLITSHIATDLEGLCDDVYLIDQGKILLHEDTDVILSDYAVLKAEEKEYQKLDQTYLLASKKEAFGYRCLTNQKQFYLENYPGLVVESCGIDDLILMMTGGR